MALSPRKVSTKIFGANVREAAESSTLPTLCEPTCIHVRVIRDPLITHMMSRSTTLFFFSPGARRLKELSNLCTLSTSGEIICLSDLTPPSSPMMASTDSLPHFFRGGPPPFTREESLGGLLSLELSPTLLSAVVTSFLSFNSGQLGRI